MSNYKLEDLKEGRILVFTDSKNQPIRYGIITYQDPNEEYHKDGKLSCVYSDGEWDTLEIILKKNFKLYESKYPLYTFINLIKSENIEFCVKYRELKEVKVKTKEELRIEELTNEINKLKDELAELTKLDTANVYNIDTNGNATKKIYYHFGN